MLRTLAGGEPILAVSGAHVAEWQTDESCDWIAPLHLHHDCDEAWYLLSGRMVFQIGDEVVNASAGDLVVAPKGQPHSFRGDGVVSTYLIFMTEKTKTLVERLHSEASTLEEKRALFRQYDAELLI